jgi:hypothetical protein
MTFADTSVNVSLCHRIGSESSDGDDAEGAVCSTIIAPFEPMLDGLSGGRRDRPDPKQCRVARLRSQTFGIVIDCQQQLCGSVVADRVASDEFGHQVVDDGTDHRIEFFVIKNFIMNSSVILWIRCETQLLAQDKTPCFSSC